MENNIPIKCPKCNKEIKQEIVELKAGGFLYLERCPQNNIHYKHYREPTFKEISEWI